MNSPQIPTSAKESLLRKMSRVKTSLTMVCDEIETTGNVAGSTLVGLEFDAEKLADFCRFIREQRRKRENAEGLI